MDQGKYAKKAKAKEDKSYAKLYVTFYPSN